MASSGRALRPRGNISYAEDITFADAQKLESSKQSILRFACRPKGQTADGVKTFQSSSGDQRTYKVQDAKTADAGADEDEIEDSEDEDGSAPDVAAPKAQRSRREGQQTKNAGPPARRSTRAAAVQATVRTALQMEGEEDDDFQFSADEANARVRQKKAKHAAVVLSSEDDEPDVAAVSDKQIKPQQKTKKLPAGSSRRRRQETAAVHVPSSRPQRSARRPAIVEEDIVESQDQDIKASQEDSGDAEPGSGSEDSELAGESQDESKEADASESGGSSSEECSEEEDAGEQSGSRAMRAKTGGRLSRKVPASSDDDEDEEDESSEGGDATDGDVMGDNASSRGRLQRAAAGSRQPSTNVSKGKAAATKQLPQEAKRPLMGKVDKILRRGPENGTFVVKFKGMSYRNLGCMTEKQIDKQGRIQLLRNFLGRGVDTEVDEAWLKVERIVAKKAPTVRSKTQYLVKWCGLEYSEATWEDERELAEDQDKVDAYHVQSKPKKAKPFKAPGKDAEGKDLPFEMPTFLNGRALRSYQEESVRWMVNNYRQRINCILGDEMGLGKTAQSISALECLRQIDGVHGPFLLVAPLTTLGHWQREIQTWTDMNVVLYAGGAEDRAIIQEYELFYTNKGGSRSIQSEDVKVEALLVSYEMLLKDRALFNRFRFSAAVFDEAHKLKGINSQTRAAVMDLDISWKLLLTGTPIQNNLSELFSILNLLDPEAHPDLEGFMEAYGDGSAGSTSEKEVRELKELLKPLLLRRMKEDVETLPEKEEVIVWVQLTVEQMQYYKALYSRQIGALLGGATAKNLPNMKNLAMELRKLCNHPFLCNGLEEDMALRRAKGLSEGFAERDLIERASGKMVLLGKLLPKLKAEGRRVLIFSQFKIMLDVLEDYIHMQGWPVERIDGSITGRNRQAAIDRYTNGTVDDSFIFLLSTRAGGQGITLTVADTCIIYDSDWNPQNDLQAMARCHRIGQEKEVTVYRLISKDTYEEHLFNTASRKYGLDEAILGGSGSSDPESDTTRIAHLLKHGAHSLVADGQEQQVEAFQSEDIDQILASRTEKRSVGGKAGNTFSVATFAVREEPDLEKLLPEAVQAFRDQEAREKAGLDRVLDGPRRRHKVNYCTGQADPDTEPDSEDSEDEDLPLEEVVEGGEQAAKDKKSRGKTSGSRKQKADSGPQERRWSKAELRALEEKLLVLGQGRWDELAEQLSLPGIPDDEVKQVGQALAAVIHVSAVLVTQQQKAAIAVAAARASSIAKGEAGQAAAPEGLDLGALPPLGSDASNVPSMEPPSSDVGVAGTISTAAEVSGAEGQKQKEPELITEEAIVEEMVKAAQDCPASARLLLAAPDNMRRLLRNAPLVKRQQLQDMAALAVLMAKPLEPGASYCNLTTHKWGLPAWWSCTHDHQLLKGIAKYGTTSWKKTATSTLTDEELGFTALVALDTSEPSKQAEPLQQQQPVDTAAEAAEQVPGAVQAAAPAAPAVGASGVGSRGVAMEGASELQGGKQQQQQGPSGVQEAEGSGSHNADGPQLLPQVRWNWLVTEVVRRLKAVLKMVLDPACEAKRPAKKRRTSSGPRPLLQAGAGDMAMRMTASETVVRPTLLAAAAAAPPAQPSGNQYNVLQLSKSPLPAAVAGAQGAQVKVPAPTVVQGLAATSQQANTKRPSAPVAVHSIDDSPKRQKVQGGPSSGQQNHVRPAAGIKAVTSAEGAMQKENVMPSNKRPAEHNDAAAKESGPAPKKSSTTAAAVTAEAVQQPVARPVAAAPAGKKAMVQAKLGFHKIGAAGVPGSQAAGAKQAVVSTAAAAKMQQEGVVGLAVAAAAAALVDEAALQTADVDVIELLD